MTVGYVGLGSMGGALATQLQRSHPLVVYDRSESAVEKLVQSGAARAARIEDLAACSVLFLCLPTSDHVDEVLFGDSGLGAKLQPGTLIVDQTTGDPKATRRMAQTLRERGIDLIDAPVSGGIAGAQAGTIAIMVGASDAQYERALPYLKAISSNLFHTGDVGAGHVIKLVNNLMSTAQRLLSFEAMTLAAKNGVDPVKAVEVLVASGGRNAYLEKMMGPRILQGKLNVGFTLGLAHKDARLACQLGIDSEVPLFFGNLTRELYQSCIAEMGRDNQVDTVGQYFDRIAGTSVVPAENDLPAKGKVG